VSGSRTARGAVAGPSPVILNSARLFTTTRRFCSSVLTSHEGLPFKLQGLFVFVPDIFRNENGCILEWEIRTLTRTDFDRLTHECESESTLHLKGVSAHWILCTLKLKLQPTIPNVVTRTQLSVIQLHTFNFNPRSCPSGPYQISL
jgi:hypothetical protein